MTFKKDFNAIVLHLLRGLVKDVMYFEEIVSGSGTNLSHIDIKVEELQNKVTLSLYLSLLHFHNHFVEFDTMIAKFYMAAYFVRNPFHSSCRHLIMVSVI